jgi:hypothetical protein
MAFLTGLARSISGIADERAADLKNERKRQQQLDEQRASEDRRYAQQEKLARMKKEVMDASRPASPEFQQALQAGDFQSVMALAARNPNDAAVAKVLMSLMSQHAAAAFGEKRRAEEAKTREEQRAASTESQKELVDYRAAKKPGKATASASPTKAKTSAPSKSQKERLSRQKELIRSLEKQLSQMETTIKTPKWWGMSEDSKPNPDAAAMKAKIAVAHEEYQRMLTGEEDKPKPAPEYILPGDDPRAPQSPKVAPKPAGKKPSEGFTKFMELRKSMLGGGQ